ncbi:MAG: lipopolysaccharide kinase InaA family protein [Planctomycetota bacterium]
MPSPPLPPEAVTPWPTPSSVEDLLRREADEVFKDDRRTRVWRVTDGRGRAWVVKRFERSPLRQRVTRWAGRHPAQRETRSNAKLRSAGVAAVPIVADGVDAEGRSWLVTPFVGPSLYHWLMRCDPAGSGADRRALTRRVGRLTGELLIRKAAHADYKASNIVLGDRLDPHLIDTGDVSTSKGLPLLASMLPMLRTLDENLRDAATYHPSPAEVTVTPRDRLRFVGAMLGAWRERGLGRPDGVQHLLRSAEFGDRV